VIKTINGVSQTLKQEAPVKKDNLEQTA